MTLVQIPEKREDEMLSDFCRNSVFTLVGVEIKKREGKKALDLLEDVLRVSGYKEKHCTAYWCYGKVINKNFGLTEMNAYPDDVVFVFIPDYHNTRVKTELRARWFDDIVSSNRIKQNAQVFGHEPDFA